MRLIFAFFRSYESRQKRGQIYGEYLIKKMENFNERANDNIRPSSTIALNTIHGYISWTKFR